MILFILFHLVFSSFSNAVEPSSRWLVQVKDGQEACLRTWWQLAQFDKSTYEIRALPIATWFVIELPSSRANEINDLSCVLRVDIDHPIYWRDTEPNDPAYIDQVDMDLIGMEKAWDVSTGGVTADGDTIVVALIDSGIQTDHVDLQGNIWFNKHEIPDDGIDNDDNSFIDDYLGVNVKNGTDNHITGNHGTSVSGVVGAKGNNGIGVTGINWNIKIMWISGADFESQLIESYQYVLEMRRKYNLSNGAEGAFVVVTNLSGGINNEFAVNHPMWCDMYDQLGQEGVLSVTAAPNLPISVDVDGDMPTTCTSPFMIAVTNVDQTDELVGNAGFGTVSIDLGAPGHGTLTTSGGNTYRDFPGTSAAAPHVTGAIALIYSTPCDKFLDDLDSDPAGVALNIKNIIFNTAVLNNSLQDMTVTGRRLQVDAAMRATVQICNNPASGPLEILSVQPNPATTQYFDVYFTSQVDTTFTSFDLYTLDGRRVQSFPISGTEFIQGFIRIDSDPLPSGIYLLTLRNRDKKTSAKLFVH